MQYYFRCCLYKYLYKTLNNNELHNNSEIFLAIVLVAGIIALSFQSFMVGSTQGELGEDELDTTIRIHMEI
ncbi:MAG: hypothetical protein ACXWFC_10005 [Nitrososphaeraceae archaeon]